MIKTINVLGIELDNYTVRESVMLVEKSLQEQSFFSIEEIGMNAILLAGKEERFKEAINNIDHTIICDTALLDAVQQSTMQRKHEIQDRTFFFELLKRLERNHKTIFLIGDTHELIQARAGFLSDQFPRLSVVGMQSMESCVGELDGIINEINSINPDVVISFLPSPEEELFLLEQKGKISAGLWYGVKETDIMPKKHWLKDLFQQKIRIRKLEKQIVDYEKNGEGEQ